MTETDNIRTELFRIISEQFVIPVEKISDFLEPGDVDSWDSIGHLQLVRKIETHFNLSFTIQDVMGFDSVRDILDTIKMNLP